MAGVFNPTPWFPFHDANGRQGWFNPATGQTTYQMYGYNGMPMMPQPTQVPMQPQMFQPQMQVPIGFVTPVQQMPQQVPQQVPTQVPTQMPPQMPQQVPPPQGPQMPPQVPQMPPQVQQQMPVGAAGWHTMMDRNGRRYYFNQATGQTIYY